MKALRHDRLAATSRTQGTTGGALRVSLFVVLFLLSLVSTAQAQQSPPVTTTWLSRISEEAADTVRPLLGIQAEAPGLVGRLAWAAQPIPWPAGPCAYCAAHMFMALEQGGNRPPLPAGVAFEVPSVSTSALAAITDTDMMDVALPSQAEQLAFLEENLGPGDHAIIGIEIESLQGDGYAGGHSINVVNIDGELQVFDAAWAGRGADGVPLREFFSRGVPGVYRVVENQFPDTFVQAVIRPMRAYRFPDGSTFYHAVGNSKITSTASDAGPSSARVRFRSDDLAAFLKREAESERKKLRQQNCAAPI